MHCQSALCHQTQPHQQHAKRPTTQQPTSCTALRSTCATSQTHVLKEVANHRLDCRAASCTDLKRATTPPPFALQLLLGLILVGPIWPAQKVRCSNTATPQQGTRPYRSWGTAVTRVLLRSSPITLQQTVYLPISTQHARSSTHPIQRPCTSLIQTARLTRNQCTYPRCKTKTGMQSVHS